MNDKNNDALAAGIILKTRYRIEYVIGSGGFGITYLATDQMSGKRVAVKEYFPKQSVIRDETTGGLIVLPGKQGYFNHMYTRFNEEGRRMHQLRCVQYMLQVYDVFRENGTAYIVMEYLDGADLSHALEKNGRIGWNQLKIYLRMLLVTMDEIHQKGLIHRDISPDNIFLTKDGQAKLIDYGSLRTYEADDRFTTVLKHSFAPFEQYRSDGHQGPWTDIYALSVTLYYALTGILVPNSPDRMMRDTVQPLDQLRADIPDHAVKAIAKGMAVKIEDRYQTAMEMYRDLFVTPVRFYLRGVDGVYKNKQLRLLPQTEISLGRGKNNLVIYPADTPGVSRSQCSVMISEKGRLMIMDHGSTYGTFIDHRQIKKEIWVEVDETSRISFGNESFTLYIEEDHRSD